MLRRAGVASRAARKDSGRISEKRPPGRVIPAAAAKKSVAESA